MVKCLHCGEKLREETLDDREGSLWIPVYVCPKCHSVSDQKSLNQFASDYGEVYGDQEVKEREPWKPECPHCGRNIFTGESVIDLDEANTLEGTKVHELKTLPEFFSAVLEGKKTFELRENDRGFKVGECLLLREWSPENGYSGREYLAETTYLLPGGKFGLDEDYCILSITEAT